MPVTACQGVSSAWTMTQVRNVHWSEFHWTGRQLLMPLLSPGLASLVMAAAISLVLGVVPAEWSAALVLSTLIPLGATVYAGALWLANPQLVRGILVAVRPVAADGARLADRNTRPVAA